MLNDQWRYLHLTVEIVTYSQLCKYMYVVIGHALKRIIPKWLLYFYL